MHGCSYIVLVSINPKFPTETEKKNYHEFLKTLHRVLPCKLCRRAFARIYGSNSNRTFFRETGVLY